MNRQIRKKSSPKQKQSKKQSSKPKKKSSSQQVFGSSLRVTAMGSSRPKSSSNGQLPSLSKCALRFALAISQPFHPSAKGACLPVYPSPPSQKVTAFGRFTASLGSGGYGFFCITPSLARDVASVIYSTATYAPNNYASPLSATNSPSVGVQFEPIGNLPYTAAQLLQGSAQGGGTVIGRIVSVGVKISYVGTTLNESGVYHIFSSPTHQNVLQVADTEGEASTQVDCEVCPIGRKSCESVLYAINEQETTFRDGLLHPPLAAIYPMCGGDNVLNNVFHYNVGTHGGFTLNMGSPALIIHFNGASGSKFLVEVVQHVEYIGLITAALVTPSDSDQRGFEIVTAAAQRIPQIRQSTGQSFASAMMTGLKEVAQAVKPIAIGALTKGLASLLL